MGRTSNANQRLMDAALSLIWEQSYGAITIDDICRQADVKKGSFYYFFESKADLAIAALDSYWKTQKLLWDSQFASTTAPLQRIRDHCDAVYRQQVEAKRRTGHVPGCPFCTLGSEICKQSEMLRAKICEILENKLSYWKSAISEAKRDGTIIKGSISEKARCACACFDGLLAQARLHNDAQMLASLADMVCGQILSTASYSSSQGKTHKKGTDETVSNDEFDSTLY